MDLSCQPLGLVNVAGASERLAVASLRAHKLQRFTAARENTRLLVAGLNIMLHMDGRL